MSVDNPAEGSNRIRVREARVEYGPNGGERLRYSWRTRDRSEPPSLREVHAALAPYFKLRSWTPEQRRALVELLAACGHVSLPPPWRRSAHGQCEHWDLSRPRGPGPAAPPAGVCAFAFASPASARR